MVRARLARGDRSRFSEAGGGGVVVAAMLKSRERQAVRRRGCVMQRSTSGIEDVFLM